MHGGYRGSARKDLRKAEPLRDTNFIDLLRFIKIRSLEACDLRN